MPDEQQPPQSKITSQHIALACILASTTLVSILFIRCVSDHDMKMMALGAAISQVSALMATASTLLVGRSTTSMPKPGTPPPSPQV